MSPDLHRLLAEARWLEALAREIVGDKALAQDLVQDVWVASLEDPSREIRDPRSWLATALRNALRREKRSSSARRHREESIARHESQEAADVVARAEAQRLLVESVLALDEPWRSTILWHYFDGLSCADIARRERLSDSTVRNRLSRALELLRERLDRNGSGGAGLSAIALLIPMPSAPHAAGAPIHVTSLGSAAAGDLLMSIGVKIAAALVASACLVWWLWPASQPNAGATLTRNDVRATEELAPAQSGSTIKRETLNELAQSSAPKTVAKETAAPAAEEPPLPTDVIEGIVLEDGVPCTRGGTIEWLRDTLGEFPPEPDAARLRTSNLAEDGTFRLVGVDWSNSTMRARIRGNITLHAFEYGMDNYNYPPGRVPVLPGRRVALRFGAASLSGHVWDEEGRPRANATLMFTVQSLSKKATGPREVNMVTFAKSDTSGAYALEHLTDGRGSGGWIFENHPDLDDRVHFMLPVERGRAYTLDFGLPHPWPKWTGTLRNRAGSAVRGLSEVFVFDPAAITSYRAISTDEEGRLSTRIVPGNYDVRIGVPFRAEQIPVGKLDVEDHDFEHDITVPGTSVIGHFNFPDGSVVDGAKYHVVVRSRLSRADPYDTRFGPVSSDGRFTIDGLEPGTYTLSTFPLHFAGGQESVEVIVRAEDFELVHDLVVTRP